MTSLRNALLLVLVTRKSASARKLSGNVEDATVNEPVVSVALSAGRGCSWTAREKALYRCEAVWTRMFAAWHVFRPRRDAGRGQVVWLVREEGFFLGVNGTGWFKKAVWKSV
ncbi:hypothetical protein NL676_021778 [Syzygium grande]|nr:hypothetical protein NL676_021778 [Syzygium grande]